MKRVSRRWCSAACVAASCWWSGADAEQADRDKPVVIESDRADLNDATHVSVFSGGVVLTKGTLVLRSDRMTVREDPEGYHFGIAVTTQPGKLAVARQKRDAVDTYMDGQAERIEYDEKGDTTRFLRKAVVKLQKAGRDTEELHGGRIDYDSRTGDYRAYANSDAAADGRRARVVLQPRTRPDEVTTPATHDAPPIELRSAPALDVEPS